MKKLVILIFAMYFGLLHSQSKTKVYTSIEDALLVPDSVYILDVSDAEIPDLTDSIAWKRLKTLKNLRSLGLYDYNISDLPSVIGQLEQLENLYVYGNKFQKFPEVLKHCKKLKYLDIGSNSIDAIPHWISKLVSLEKLYMNENRKFDSNQYGKLKLSSSLTKLPNLKTLDLTKTNLREIPDWFSEIKSLKHLNIDSNSLKGLPKSMEGMALRTIRMYETNFREFPDFIFNMTQLDSLELVYSEDEFQFPDTIKAPLKYLFLGFRSNVDQLPDAITKLDKLENLSFYRFPLDSLPESFVNLKSLKILHILKSGITSLPSDFGNLSNLEELKISGTIINYLPDSFVDLKKLKTIKCNVCGLFELPDSFGNLKALEKLELTNTYLEKLPRSFGTLTNLRELELDLNRRLTSLPESFGGLTKLERLDFFGNSIANGIPGIASLKSLRTLKISDRSFSTQQKNEIKAALPKGCTYKFSSL